MIRRFEDWPEQLNRFIAANRNRPLEWGQWDCCLFPAAVIDAITGVDLAVKWRGTYRDELGALRLLAAFGSMEAMATSMLGAPRESQRHGQRGDVAIFIPPIVKPTDKGRPNGAVVVGRDALVFNEAGGLVGVPLRACYKVWQV